MYGEKFLATLLPLVLRPTFLGEVSARTDCNRGVLPQRKGSIRYNTFSEREHVRLGTWEQTRNNPLAPVEDFVVTSLRSDLRLRSPFGSEPHGSSPSP